MYKSGCVWLTKSLLYTVYWYNILVMAPPADAGVSSSLKLHYILLFIYYFFTFITEAHIIYDRKSLINIRKGTTGIGLSAMDLEVITAHNVFRPPSQTSQTKRHRKWCRKRGKRAGIRAKLTQPGPKATALPSLLLANVWLQENKMGEMRLGYGMCTAQDRRTRTTRLQSSFFPQAVRLQLTHRTPSWINAHCT